MSKEIQPSASLTTIKTKWLSFTLLFFIIYATLRYIIFKGVDPIHYPLYITNKILSTSGLFLLAISYSWTKISWLKLKQSDQDTAIMKYTGLMGFSLSAIHVFISIIILNPAYFPKFYAGDMMNFKGELSMLMGTLSVFFFTIPAITSIPFMQEAIGFKEWHKRQQIGYLGLITALVHVIMMGFSTWFDVDKWPGYLPPITLIAALLAIVPLYLKLTKSK